MNNKAQHSAILTGAMAAHARGDLTSAEAGYRKVLTQCADHPDALNLLGVLLNSRGQVAAAEGLIQRAAERLPESADVLSNLAMVQLAAGKLEQAELTAGRALALAPAHLPARYFRAAALEQSGSTLLAAAAYQEILSVNPAWLPARQALYRLVEPDGRDIHWLEQMAWQQPASEAWRDGLRLAVAAKVPALLRRGNLAQADILRLIDQSLALNAPAESARWRDELAVRLGVDGGAPAAAPRYLLIRAWGCGFWSDVDHLLGQLLLAEITGRTPVVHWGENSLYGGTRSEDAWRYFFESISDVKAVDLPWANALVYPPKWNADNATGPDLNQWEGEFSRQSAVLFLCRCETIVVSDFHTQVRQLAAWVPASHPLSGRDPDAIYRYLIAKYLHPRPDLLAEVDRFISERFAGRPYVAVHLRGLDKGSECHDLAAENAALLARVGALRKQQPGLGIFVLTDDLALLAEARRQFGDQVVVSDCTRSNGTQGVHFQSAKDDQRRLGVEVLQDALIASRAAAFVGLGSSNVGAMIAYLGNWQPGAFSLQGRSLHQQFNLMLNNW